MSPDNIDSTFGMPSCRKWQRAPLSYWSPDHCVTLTTGSMRVLQTDLAHDGHSSRVSFGLPGSPVLCGSRQCETCPDDVSWCSKVSPFAVAHLAFQGSARRRATLSKARVHALTLFLLQGSMHTTSIGVTCTFPVIVLYSPFNDRLHVCPLPLCSTM